METAELVFGSVLVVVLLSLAGYYGWRQVRTLRSLKSPDDRSAEERRFVRRQAWLRLVGSGLMVIFAGLLVGSAAFNATTASISFP